MEIIFHSHANKTHFHKKGCAPSLILKVRVFGTRKWPIDNVPPWYSLVQSKSLYESEDVQAFWDIPVFAGQTSGRKDSRSSSKDSNNSGNELPLDPGSREEIQAVSEGTEVWTPMLGDSITSCRFFLSLSLYLVIYLYIYLYIFYFILLSYLYNLCFFPLRLFVRVPGSRPTPLVAAAI